MTASGRGGSGADPPSGGHQDADSVLDLIRQKGGRASTASRVVIESLTAAKGRHRTVDQLATEIRLQHPEIHQTTVYRNLERLEALGVAYHTHLGHGPAQWHLANAAHPHLTCEHCGSVAEVPEEVFAWLQDALYTNIGFRVDLRHFALTGTCRSCGSGGPASAAGSRPEISRGEGPT